MRTNHITLTENPAVSYRLTVTGILMNILCEQWAGKCKLTARTGRRVAPRGRYHPLHHSRGRYPYLQQVVLRGPLGTHADAPEVDNTGDTGDIGPDEPSSVYLLRAIISGVLFHRGSPLPREGRINPCPRGGRGVRDRHRILSRAPRGRRIDCEGSRASRPL